MTREQYTKAKEYIYNLDKLRYIVNYIDDAFNDKDSFVGFKIGDACLPLKNSGYTSNIVKALRNSVAEEIDILEKELAEL